MSTPSRALIPGERLSSILLAIDGGGSNTRCLAYDIEQQRELGKGFGGSSNPFEVGYSHARDSLKEAVDGSLSNSEVGPKRILGICAGLSGVEIDGTGLSENVGLLASLGHKVLGVFSDLMIAHEAAFAGKAGVLVLSGTGAAALGIDELGAKHCVDGWGPLLGDDGSGFWIGREALRASARYCDSRGPKTALADLFCEKLGVKHFSDAVSQLHSWEASAISKVAALCDVVRVAAEDGDTVANMILDNAAECLTESVSTVLTKMGEMNPSPMVSYQGGLFNRSSAFVRLFTKSFKKRHPNIDISPPKLEPLYGALAIGLRLHSQGNAATI